MPGLSGIPDLGTLFSGQLQIFVLVLARMTAMMSLLPVFGSQAVPVRVRPVLAILLAILLFPLLPHREWALPEGVPAYMLLVLREAILGVITGYVLSLSFLALESAGSLIDSAAGFSMVELFDPMTGMPAALFGQFLSICASVTFVMGGGHLHLLRILSDSYRIAPLGEVRLEASALVPQLVEVLIASFLIGLQLAGAVLMALLLLTLVLAVLSRVMPSMNVWIISMPLQIVTACFVTGVSLPWILEGFRGWHEHLVNTSLSLLGKMH